MTGAHEDVGRVVTGRYRLLRRLGVGGMGRVWLAYDQELACEVAVKEIVLPPGVPEREVSSRIARARGEARHAARLRNHPHVVTVHDIVEEDGLPWIVMEFVPGAMDLEAVVRERGRCRPRRSPGSGWPCSTRSWRATGWASCTVTSNRPTSC